MPSAASTLAAIVAREPLEQIVTSGCAPRRSSIQAGTSRYGTWRLPAM
jgi:hypothetical protein